MIRYPIHLNYNMNEPSIGFIQIQDDKFENELREGALVPFLSKAHSSQVYTVTAFGLVPRTTVDTKPRDLS